MPRNVIILHTDEQRYDSLGCTGDPCARTPHLDALASEGTLFTRHIVANPICQPSRASLLTGRCPENHRLLTNGWNLPRAGYPKPLPGVDDLYRHWYGNSTFAEETIPTLPDVLSGAGYRTAAFGKLHLTTHHLDTSYGLEESYQAWERGVLNEEWTGPYYGFEHVEFTLGHGEHPCRPTGGHYYRWLHRNYPDVVELLKHENHPHREIVEGNGNIYLSPIPPEAHNTMWLADRASGWIEQTARQDKPFCMFVGFPDPHTPIVPPERIAELFADMPVPPPRMSDEELQTAATLLQRSLHSEGIHNLRNYPYEVYEKVIRYTAAMVHLVDRGVGQIIDTLKRVGAWDDTIVIFTSDHGDWLGEHGLLYKDEYPSSALVRVPFIMRVPGSDLPGRVDSPCSNVDVMPTVLSLLGVTAPEGMDGGNMLADGSSRMLPMVSCYPGICGSYPFCSATTDDMNLSIVDDRYRYTAYPVSGEMELYDHTNDPAELRNLCADAYRTDDVDTICRNLHERLLAQHEMIASPSCKALGDCA